jgi:ATP-dependent exoDNAse (exonuclease V) beta subunit
MSILRSYIYRTNDNDIFDIYENESFKDTELYKKLYDISLSIDGLSNKEVLIKLINEFDMFNKLILVGDIKERSSKLEYFINNADSLNKFGLDIYSLNEYFDRILDSDDDLKMGGNGIAKNSVKIMTIHKSKGLEFPFVYLPYLNSRFISNKETRYPLSEKYGIVLPYNEDNILDNTFVKKIYDINELKETISEKIRLLYVAITRAREQFILINSWNDKLNPIDNISSLDLLNCKSYTDIFSIMRNTLNSFTDDINLDDINLSKDYNLYSNTNYDNLIKDTNKVISTKKLDIEYNLLENKHFSKALTKIMDKSFKELLDFGTMMHYCFEVYDFNHDNLNELNISDEYKNNIRNFLKHDEVKNISSAITYKEHEILFNKDGSIFHGFIDLLVEYNDHFDIIDYKLSNIDSEEYVNQLNGYKEYIESTYNKPCNMYLYSIKKDKFKKL